MIPWQVEVEALDQGGKRQTRATTMSGKQQALATSRGLPSALAVPHRGLAQVRTSLDRCYLTLAFIPRRATRRAALRTVAGAAWRAASLRVARVASSTLPPRRTRTDRRRDLHVRRDREVS